MKEKIYGYFAKGETEGAYDVTVVIPRAYAEFFCVDRQWDMALEGDDLDLRWAAVEAMEAAGDMLGELYEGFCAYLEDGKNRDVDVEEAEVCEGVEAARMFLAGRGLGPLGSLRC